MAPRQGLQLLTLLALLLGAALCQGARLGAQWHRIGLDKPPDKAAKGLWAYATYERDNDEIRLHTVKAGDEHASRPMVTPCAGAPGRSSTGPHMRDTSSRAGGCIGGVPLAGFAW